MIGDSRWTTSVGELLENFRQGLIALAPIFERARLPWEDGQAYHQWDSVSEALFEALVAKTVMHARELSGSAGLPGYGFSYESLPTPHFVRVEAAEIDPSRVARFVSFGSAGGTFSIIHWCYLRRTETSALGDAEGGVAAFSEVRFSIGSVGDPSLSLDMLVIDDDGASWERANNGLD